MSDTVLYTHDSFLKHRMGLTNPESPVRLEKINELLFASGALSLLEQKQAPVAALTDLLAAHDEDYIRFLSNKSPKEGLAQVNVDTSMNPFTWEAAQHAAGAAARRSMIFAEATVKRPSAPCVLRDTTRTETIRADSAF